MKAYVLTTGLIFGLLTVAHLFRIILENRHLVADPFFILLTMFSASLCATSSSFNLLSQPPSPRCGTRASISRHPPRQDPRPIECRCPPIGVFGVRWPDGSKGTGDDAG